MCVCIVSDSINRPVNLYHRPFNLYIGSQVTCMMSFHPASFVLPRLAVLTVPLYL